MPDSDYLPVPLSHRQRRELHPKIVLRQIFANMVRRHLTSRRPPQDLLQAASAMPEKPVALELESDEEDSRIDAQTLPELKVFKP